jgi:hypothetical protein
MGFIFPHCFQEDFDVDGVSNMFLPQGSVQGYGGFEFVQFKVCIDLLVDSFGYLHRQMTCPCGEEYGEPVTHCAYIGVISQAASRDSR